MYYIDSCIWINLFKKEVGNGKPYWFFAKQFILNNADLFYSEVVLRELQVCLPKTMYAEKKEFITQSAAYVDLTDTDKSYARRLESVYQFKH